MKETLPSHGVALPTDCHQHLDERNIPCCKACLGPSQSQQGIRKKKYIFANKYANYTFTYSACLCVSFSPQTIPAEVRIKKSCDREFHSHRR
jgi:hypothetical protein